MAGIDSLHQYSIPENKAGIGPTQIPGVGSGPSLFKTQSFVESVTCLSSQLNLRSLINMLLAIDELSCEVNVAL